MESKTAGYIADLLGVSIQGIKSISGGDISKAFLIETNTERLFCKLNYSPSALEMFQTERLGLESIANTQTIATPKVFLTEALEEGAVLVMEYIEPRSPNTKDFETLGHHLADLHKISDSDTFGWESDNFIGSLPQYNHQHSDWTSFYINERLAPQLKIAIEKGLLEALEIPSLQKMESACSDLFQSITPSLLHGDLWGGNFLISQKGVPYLIDSAVYHGHYEVDIAMTRLFGGFSAAFYSAYQETMPQRSGYKERQDLYQLYYLLVHLNLFGRSYYGSVKTILNNYFV